MNDLIQKIDFEAIVKKYNIKIKTDEDINLLVESLQSAECAFNYAYDVIEGRWLEAEPIILTDAGWAYLYAQCVIKGRWPEAEPIIIKNNDAEWAYLYAVHVIKGKWPEAEPIILTDTKCAHFYAKDKDIIGKYGRLKRMWTWIWKKESYYAIYASIS